jgi:thioredoxin reductase (NADPH)
MPQISGLELATKMEEHALRLCGESFVENSIESAGLEGDVKVIRTVDGREYRSLAVIIATGATHRKLEVKGEEEYSGRGVSYCATCDGAFFKGKTVAVVGGGNTAAMDALFLAGLCAKVYIIHRRNVLRADKLLQDRLFKTGNIEILWNSRVEEIVGTQEGVNGIRIQNMRDGSEKETAVNGVFAAVGIVPMSEPFGDALKTDEDGYIIADESCVTNINGVFAAGDIRSKALRQVVTAVSDGANAVTSATRYISMLS